MKYAYLSRLSLMAGCILLLVGLFSCSSEETKFPEVEGDEMVVVNHSQTAEKQHDELVDEVVDTSFYEIAYMVLNAPGRSLSEDYINNQIVFESDQFRYTVWTTHPHDNTPIFSVWRRPKGTTSKKVLETWSVDMNDGELNFYLNPEREGFSFGTHRNVDTDLELSNPRKE